MFFCFFMTIPNPKNRAGSVMLAVKVNVEADVTNSAVI